MQRHAVIMLLVVALFVLGGTACTRTTAKDSSPTATVPVPRSPSPADTDATEVRARQPVDLVDPQYQSTDDGHRQWDYQRVATADLDDDGTEENIIVTAAVPRAPQEGEHEHEDAFIWNDGQPWQVYVEEPGGERTYVFAQFVQLGKLDVFVTAEPTEEHGKEDKQVLIDQSTVHAKALYVIDYQGTQEFQAYELARIPIAQQAHPVME